MHVDIVRAGGLVALGNGAREAGYVPGTAVQIVVLSTGSLLIQPADADPYAIDLDRLALTRKSGPKRKALDNGQ